MQKDILMTFTSSREALLSRLLKPSLLLAGSLALFLNACISGVTEEKGIKESPNTSAVAAMIGDPEEEDVATWTDMDIGGVGHAGSATLSGTTLTVRGSGADIWGAADGFHFKYTFGSSSSYGFTLTARVTGVQATDPWAKAGIMFRNTTTPDAPHVFLALTSANGVAFQHRDVTGGESFHTGSAGGSPVWLRLKFAGSTITGYRSNDGVNWTQVGELNVSNYNYSLAGFAVTSHNNSALNTATFDNITWSNYEPRPEWPSADIGNVGRAGRTMYSGGKYSSLWVLEGAGGDIFNNADAFHFHHHPLVGDGSMVVTVSSISDTHQWAKAGLMIRESTAPGSRHVYIGLTPSGVVEFLRREVEGGSTTPVAFPAGIGNTFKVARVGNVFTVYCQYSGSDSWTQMGQVTMDLKPDVLIGFAVTSHNPSVLNKAYFIMHRGQLI